ncbi:MAG: tRNA (uridine(34)/cytosine(34)/5-carboxymethylaminomethyluridine(34)-2'-O)-methyltransferase TrmL [Syntrophomonadaceae bacterium]|nr:tRNA (uridine(34)/cytosine(34)/5-carboxymethylaminomethyluridine(34)-2'-O)-methyltransferase TrmL [Syntrophomonadaceae bacterium]
MNIVLVEPEIPQNTGNIARTCALTNSVLHLVRPLGFSLEDRYLKRAGLDYWKHVRVVEWNSFEELVRSNPEGRFWLATTKCNNGYSEVTYDYDDFLVFGKETGGLSKGILAMFSECHIRIPMIDIGRSLNLANSVAVVLYEALRQQGYPGLR